MRNTKELKSILTCLYCINQTGQRDEDISRIIDYTFHRMFNGNANLLTLACIGRTKEDVMPEIKQILEEDTQYSKYLEIKGYDKNNWFTSIYLSLFSRW